MNAEVPSPDLAECERFAAFWRGLTGLPHITLTAITPDGPTSTATFNRGQASRLRDWILRAQSDGRNVYFQPNETPADCTSKPTKGKMVAAVCRHADIDPDDERYPLAEERRRLHALADELRSDPRAAPSVVIDSGNGLQPLWATAREALTPDVIERIESENRVIEGALGALGTHDVSRLLRLPGTLNFPNRKKRSLGRNVCRARLLHAVETLYPAERIPELCRELIQRFRISPLVRAPSNKKAGSGGERPADDAEPERDLLKRIEAAAARWPTLKRRWEGDWSGLNDSSDSGKAIALGAALKHAGFSFEDMCSALRSHRDTSEWTATKGEAKDRRELRRIWERAGSDARHAAEAEIAAESWPEPIAADAYHGLAGDVVRAIEPHTEADPVALLIQFLAFYGNAIGRGPHYQVEGDRHATNIFAVLVGETSKARKGTSAGRIRSIFELAHQQWARERIHSGMSSGEGLIWAVRDPITARVRDGKGAGARYVEQETDAGVADKRLMILEPEFAGALRVMERQGNILSRIVRDAWDRADLATLTKNSPARATGAHISIVGHITDNELQRSLDRVEMANGFANRFLFACVRRARILPHGGNLSEQSVLHLANRTAAALAHARKLGRVDMTADARDDWARVYPALSEGRPGLLGAVVGRAEAQVIRLALLYALLDQKADIAREHLRAAVAVWEYCEASARHIFGDLLGDPDADEILHALRRTGEAGMTRTEIRDLFGRHRSAPQIDRALAYFARQGKAARTSQTATGGRPTELWTATTAKGQ